MPNIIVKNKNLRSGTDLLNFLSNNMRDIYVNSSHPKYFCRCDNFNGAGSWGAQGFDRDGTFDNGYSYQSFYQNNSDHTQILFVSVWGYGSGEEDSRPNADIWEGGTDFTGGTFKIQTGLANDGYPDNNGHNITDDRSNYIIFENISTSENWRGGMHFAVVKLPVGYVLNFYNKTAIYGDYAAMYYYVVELGYDNN